MDQIQTGIYDASPAISFVYGHGPSMQALNAMAAEFARTNIAVLILGESGTGKDAYARLIHRLSPLGNSPLRRINCSAFAASELQDYVSEAMHAAARENPLPSVYLDNIQELDLAVQRVLLSHLPDEESTGAIGGPQFRLISSSTQNLKPEVASGHFRGELYFRLNGASLRLPPLRERKEDIPVLAEYFLNKHAALMKKRAPTLSNKALEILTAYHWPGNIRELENLLRKMVVLEDVQIVLNDVLSSGMAPGRPVIVAPGAPLKVAARAASKQAERELILQALDRTRWNRKRAARELQISYKSLLYKIKQLRAYPEQHQNGGQDY